MMTRRQTKRNRFPILAASLSCLLIAFTSPPSHAMEAGAAKVDITPPLGTPLNGYFDRLGRGAYTVHDPVWARALYVDDGETRIFLICADLCVINRELRERVLELAPDIVPKNNIILTATHTHSAQGGMMKPLLFRSVSGRFVPEVLEATAQRLVEAMTTAYNARKRATIGYATATQQTLSTNRVHEAGPIDPQIGVIRVEDADGLPIAIVANFAAHPTTVGGASQFAISADYVGYYYDELELLTAPTCVPMFMNGAEANQRCAAPDNTDGWARTEAIGRKLAASVKTAADTIACEPAKLKLGFATPSLPPTLAASVMPSSTILQTLEIGELLLCFFPGEPSVEIGLELRQRALARGYKAQFSVGLANDYLLYFIPPEFYSHMHYESAMNFYGPRIADWFYTEFSKLMALGQPTLERPAPLPAAPAVVAFGPAQSLQLNGTPYGIGFQRGAAFRETLQQAFSEKVVKPCDDGRLIPQSGMWKLAPSFIDTTILALPRLGIGARPLLAGLSPAAFEEVEGLADGAALPFDAAWLLQCMPTYSARGDNTDDMYRSPFCTMFAAVGDRAGADDLLIGRNLDWADPEPPVILDITPNTGHHFVHVGFPWNVGVFTGMNDAGIVVCAERVEPLGEPSIDGPPVELVLRGLLQNADSIEAALAILAEAKHLRGYHVLLAGPETAGAHILELGPSPLVREPIDGLLLGADPASQNIDPAAKSRYARIAQRLAEERIISIKEIKETLQDTLPRVEPSGCILNPNTRHSVVFEPNALKLHVAFQTKELALSEYQTLSIQKETRND